MPEPTKPARHFPPPWSIKDYNDACFIVRDANQQALAFVYCEDEPGRRTTAKLLTRDEARRIAPAKAVQMQVMACAPALVLRRSLLVDGHQAFLGVEFYRRDCLTLPIGIPRDDAALIEMRGLQFALLTRSYGGRLSFGSRPTSKWSRSSFSIAM